MELPDLDTLIQLGQEGLVAAALLLAAVAVGWVGYRILFTLVSHWARRREGSIEALLVRHWRAPLRVCSPLFACLLVVPSLRLPQGPQLLLRQSLGLAFIAALAWLSVRTVFVVRDAVLQRYDLSMRDNLKARAVHTQIRVVEQVAVVIILVIAVASMLMAFERIRQVGVSLLASAGILGIIVGFAAQKSIATLFAGIQIAVTQPIRLDDVVIVEGEWGRIEEITLTYVVVRIWDLRRLVVPVTYFIDKPFQNWTRVSADLLGTVFLYADYRLPVDAVRSELKQILESSARWDGKTWGLVVTNAGERTLELRALMSAADSGTAWDLRCEVREKLLAAIQDRYPECLPRVRAELPPTLCDGHPDGAPQQA